MKYTRFIQNTDTYGAQTVVNIEGHLTRDEIAQVAAQLLHFYPDEILRMEPDSKNYDFWIGRDGLEGWVEVKYMDETLLESLPRFLVLNKHHPVPEIIFKQDLMSTIVELKKVLLDFDGVSSVDIFHPKSGARPNTRTFKISGKKGENDEWEIDVSDEGVYKLTHVERMFKPVNNKYKVGGSLRAVAAIIIGV